MKAERTIRKNKQAANRVHPPCRKKIREFTSSLVLPFGEEILSQVSFERNRNSAIPSLAHHSRRALDADEIEYPQFNLEAVHTPSTVSFDLRELQSQD